MNYYALISEALHALYANKLRSTLTIIGIIVGISSVTAMLALGAGLSKNIVSRISSFSQGDVSISGNTNREDLAWVREHSFVKGAVGMLTLSATDLVACGESFSVTSRSALGDLTTVQPFTVTEGTAFDFTDASYIKQEMLVSSELRDAVQKKTGCSLVGNSVSLGGQRFSVVGVLSLPTAGFSRNDGTVYLPYRVALASLTSSPSFSSINVSLTDSNYFEIAGKDFLEGLNVSRGLARDSDDSFTVSSAQSIIESVQQTVSMIRIFLGIVGGIALFVGGIGTMNMMLTTVTERTKEIGLRKAIGARRRDILLQILCESVLLTTIGGALGIALTTLLALVANSLLSSSSPISVVVSPSVVLLATCVSIVVGVVFGLYPARNASTLPPAEALRAE
jgi:putative ABC transport system permease protein